MRASGVSSRCIEPVTVWAAPWKVTLIPGAERAGFIFPIVSQPGMPRRRGKNRRFMMMRSILILIASLGFVADLSAQPAAKIPILFDFDIGEDIDDTFALATILASPELDLRGVTTVGHDPFKRAQMASRFLT